MAQAQRGVLSRSWPAVPASVAEARRAAGDFAVTHGATPAALAAVELAVSEAATNVVQHAYVGAPAGVIHLSAEPADGALVVTVADEGSGMRPRPDSAGLGLGLPLISQMTTSFEVQRLEPRGTVLCMRFDLHRGQL